MSQSLFDMDSWRRAWGPALRVFGYISALYVVTFILLIVPASIIVSLGGPALVNQLAGFLAVLIMIFSFFLSFFKVLDEQRPGDIPLELVK